jgi:hypothetical protein
MAIGGNMAAQKAQIQKQVTKKSSATAKQMARSGVQSHAQSSSKSGSKPNQKATGRVATLAKSSPKTKTVAGKSAPLQKALKKEAALSKAKSSAKILPTPVVSAKASASKTKAAVAKSSPSTVSEVARSLKSKAKSMVDTAEKAMEKAVGKVSAALDVRRTTSKITNDRPKSAVVSNLLEKISSKSTASIDLDETREESGFVDTLSAETGAEAIAENIDDSSEEKSKTKKLQVFRSRAERLKVERLISDGHQPVQKRWAAIHDQLKHLKAAAYDMTGQYDLKTPVIHKVLGWGFIVEIRDSRMDVMFKDGLKTLIMNYKR